MIIDTGTRKQHGRMNALCLSSEMLRNRSENQKRLCPHRKHSMNVPARSTEAEYYRTTQQRKVTTDTDTGPW